jgi:hypothetical protein
MYVYLCMYYKVYDSIIFLVLSPPALELADAAGAGCAGAGCVCGTTGTYWTWIGDMGDMGDIAV